MLKIVLFLLISCTKLTIDGVSVKKLTQKNELLKEARLHIFGQDNRKKSPIVAEYYLKKAWKISPTDPATTELLVTLYKKYDKNIKVEETYLKYLTYKPSDQKTLLLLAKHYANQNRINDAKKYLKKCTNITKEPYLKCYQELASLYEKNKEYKRAIMIYRAQLRFYRSKLSDLRNAPDMGVIFLKLANLYYKLKKYDFSLKAAINSQKLTPKNWPTHRKAETILLNIEKKLAKTKTTQKKYYSKAPIKFKTRVIRRREYRKLR